MKNTLSYRSFNWLGLFLFGTLPIAYSTFSYHPAQVKNLILGIFLSFIFLIFLFRFYHYEWQLRSDRIIFIGIIFYIFISIVSIFTTPPQTNLHIKYISELTSVLFCFIFYALLARNIKREYFSRISGIAGFITLSIGFYTVLTQHIKPVSTFGNPNFFGAYLVCIFPVLWLLLKDSSKPFKILGILNLIILGVNIFWIRSWAVWLSLSFSIPIIFLCFSKNKKNVFSTTFALALIFFFIFRIPFIQESLVHQIANDVRPFIWKGSLVLIQDHFYLGCGVGQFLVFYPQYRPPDYFTHPLSVDTTDHAHCELIEIFSETGLIGMISFLVLLGAIIFFTLKAISKNPKQNRTASLAYLIGALALFFENLFDVNLRYISSKFIFWSFLGLAYGLATQPHGQNKSNTKKLPLSIILLITIIVFYGWGWISLRGWLGDYYFKKAVVERNNQNYASAIQFYKRSLLFEPKELEVLYRQAYLYALMGENTKAAQTYEKVLTLAPLYSSAHGNLGTLKARLGELDKAYEHLMIQYQLNPYEPDRIATLASVLLRMEKIEEARKYLRKALLLNPEHEFAKKALSELTSSKD